MAFVEDCTNALANYVRNSISADPARKDAGYDVKIGVNDEGYPNIGIFKPGEKEPFIAFVGSDGITDPDYANDSDLHFDTYIAYDYKNSDYTDITYGKYHDYQFQSLYFDYNKDFGDKADYDSDAAGFLKDIAAIDACGSRMMFMSKSEIDTNAEKVMNDCSDRFAIMAQIRNDFERLSENYPNLVVTDIKPDVLEVSDSTDDDKAVYHISYDIDSDLYRSDNLWQAKISSASISYSNGIVYDPAVIADSDFHNKTQAINILSSVGCESYEIALDPENIADRSDDIGIINGFDVYNPDEDNSDDFESHDPDFTYDI